MSNNPTLNYKPDLFMSKPVPVELQAGDWAVFMSWLVRQETEGVSYIVMQISNQIIEALFTPASIKATDARYHEEAEQTATARIIFPFVVPPPTDDPA